jgi:hypothetical protein
MPADMDALADDVAAETVVLRELVAGLDEQAWRQATPAPGWSIADQLSHLAHFDEAAVRSAIRPREFSANRGRPLPEQPVRVELLSPGRDMWLWGPPEAADRVTGSALDFCLAVTRRRHLDDTSLLISGPVATEWMSIAQAFAGPPGPGRRPGQFRRGPSRGR